MSRYTDLIGRPTEKDVERACDLLMRALGFNAVRFSQARASMQTRGIPDRKYYRDRFTFWFECKRQGGKQSPDQLAFQRMAEEAGELYLLGGLAELEFFLIDRGFARKSPMGTWSRATV